ncbi:MAG TPA: serine/threonine-protein kinase, partial [Myxococcaceae bacterium]|nr:serine/threonine-protein kinase [Myxococcaceae bacterium]
MSQEMLEAGFDGGRNAASPPWEEADGESTRALLEELVRVESASPVPHAGERLGGAEGQRFELLAPLGHGGMGRVFRARDTELGREVALKFLDSRSGGASAGELERLRREARAQAQHAHENIARLFDVAEWASPGGARVPFLVMECLDGEPLSTVLRRGPMALRRALEVLRAVASALAHAHARHVIHRDLKPGNV